MSLLTWLITPHDPERDRRDKERRAKVIERERLIDLRTRERERLAHKRQQEADKRRREREAKARKLAKATTASGATTTRRTPTKPPKAKARKVVRAKVRAVKPTAAPAPVQAARTQRRTVRATVAPRAAPAPTAAQQPQQAAPARPVYSGPAVKLADAKTAAATLGSNGSRFKQSDLAAALGLAFPSQDADQITARLLAAQFIVSAGATGYRLTGNP